MCIDRTTSLYDTVQIKLTGTTTVTKWQKHVKRDRRYLKRETESKQFLTVDEVLVQSLDAIATQSPTAYTFKIQMPLTSLPSSLAVSRKTNGLEGQVQYNVRAVLMQDGN